MAREKFERSEKHINIGFIGTGRNYVPPTSLSAFAVYMSSTQERLDYLKNIRAELVEYNNRMIHISEDEVRDIDDAGKEKKSKSK